MTGTALTEEQEFRKIYNLPVVEVPTNRPVIRVMDDAVYMLSIKHELPNQGSSQRD